MSWSGKDSLSIPWSRAFRLAAISLKSTVPFKTVSCKKGVKDSAKLGHRQTFRSSNTSLIYTGARTDRGPLKFTIDSDQGFLRGPRGGGAENDG